MGAGTCVSTGSCIAEDSDNLKIDVHIIDNDISGLNVSTAPAVYPASSNVATPLIVDSKFGLCPYVKEVLSDASAAVKDRAKSAYYVKLTTKPTASVTVTPTAANTLQIEIKSQPLTFTTANWNVPQLVEVAAKHDQEAEQDVQVFNTTGHRVQGHSSLVYHMVASAGGDSKYHALQQLVNENLEELPNKKVYIKDIDNVGICIARDDGQITGTDPQCDSKTSIRSFSQYPAPSSYINIKEEVLKGEVVPESKQIHVRLLTKPAGNVDLNAEASTTLGNLLNVQAVVTPAKITFTPDNWETPQAFAVRARADDMYEEPTSSTSRALIRFSVDSVDPLYNQFRKSPCEPDPSCRSNPNLPDEYILPSAQIFIEDDDEAGIELKRGTASTDSVNWDVVLKSKPITRVNIQVYTSSGTKQAVFSNGQ